MKALHKQRLCSLSLGLGEMGKSTLFYPKTAWDISPRPFFPFPRGERMPPYSQFLADSS